MKDLIRESPVGQAVRWISNKRILQYPEERADFVLPLQYITTINSEKGLLTRRSSDGAMRAISSAGSTRKVRHTGEKDFESLRLSRTKSRLDTEPYSNERLQVEQQLALERTQTIPIIPKVSSDGTILVDWYTTDDPANPQNWSNMKRGWVAIVIGVYTFVVYAGSAIYTPSESGVIHEFNVNETETSLPLALYVLAYGIGPLLWAPLSEIPIIGRSPVYITTFFLFTILSLPTAMVNNFAGLLVLRFLQGFFGSPCLANGPASMQDIYSLLNLPYALVAWVACSFCGPALGPVISAFAVTAEGWRWSLWEILWAAGPVLIVMALLLPETSSPTILLQRAARLRKLTGDPRIKSQGEIDQKNLTPTGILLGAVIKPIEITLKDPAIAFVNLYTALVYATYYSFFEVFPLVYPPMYGFSLGMVGVVFTCIQVACFIGMAVYIAYLYFYLVPDIKKNGMRAQEHRLVPAIIASFGPPLGLFIFAWTSNPSIHWIAPTIGITIYATSVFVILQCVFVYVPLSYPQYAASLFAGNDFVRSATACGSILFSKPMFNNLGVGKGVSVLGGLSTLGIFGMITLYLIGAKLRARSKFAQSG